MMLSFVTVVCSTKHNCFRVFSGKCATYWLRLNCGGLMLYDILYPALGCSSIKLETYGLFYGASWDFLMLQLLYYQE